MKTYQIRFFNETGEEEIIEISAKDSWDRQDQIDGLWTPEREAKYTAVEW